MHEFYHSHHRFKTEELRGQHIKQEQSNKQPQQSLEEENARRSPVTVGQKTCKQEPGGRGTFALQGIPGVHEVIKANSETSMHNGRKSWKKLQHPEAELISTRLTPEPTAVTVNTLQTAVGFPTGSSEDRVAILWGP